MDTDTHSQLQQAVAIYKTPPRAIELLKQHPPLLLAGITAAGKETVARRLEQISDWRQITTHTTRQPRPGEQDGRDYWFVDQEQMLELLNQQAMFEVKLVHGETFYGSSIQAYQNILNSEQQPLFVLDVQGVQELLKHLPLARPIFLLPPSLELWLQRLDGRGEMSHVERLRRFASAEKEIQTAIDNQQFALVVNRELNLAADEIIRGSFSPHTQQDNRRLAQQLLDDIHRLK